ncbi:MAG: hypothetical protein WDZ45_14095 [Flavobacteriaceae bacterium]
MQKTISILFSLLLLLSTTGLTYGQHFCEGVVVEFALSFGAEKMNCDEAEAEDSCEDTIQENDCCADVYYQVQADTDFAGKSFEPASELPVLGTSVSFHSLLAADPLKEKHPETHYLPPDIDTDRLSLFQVFLI